MVFSSNIINYPNASGMNGPSAVALDPLGHRLFVADTFNNRVLVFLLSAANDFTGVAP